jgi:hypothetical protein
MGVRVQFWEEPEDDIKKAIIKDFEKFKEWYISLANEYPDDADYEVLEIIEGITNPNELFQKIDD